MDYSQMYQLLSLSAQFNWWNTPIDNLAMSDGVTLDLEFDLTQNEITP